MIVIDKNLIAFSATDLANHFRAKVDQEKMVQSGYDKTNPQHHDLLLCLIMTTADLSDQVKTWSVCHHVTVSFIY